MYLKIINPKTKRKVSIHSRSGRLILQKYLKQIGGTDKKQEDKSDDEWELVEPKSDNDWVKINVQHIPILKPQEVVNHGNSSPIPHTSKYVFNDRFENITYLYGFIGLHYYKFGKKKILLLSDEHAPLVEIIPMSQEAIYFDEFIIYLAQTLANNDECLDFYLENPLNKEQGNPHYSTSLIGGMYISDIPPRINHTTLNIIRAIFKNCTSIVNDSCTINKCRSASTIPTETKLNNLRLHNIDLRMREHGDDHLGIHSLIGELSSPFSELTYDQFDVLLQFILDIQGHKTPEQIKNMCIDVIGCEKNKTKIYIDKIISVKRKINKEQGKFNAENIFGSPIDINNIIYQYYKSSPEVLQLDEARPIILVGTLIDIYTIYRMFINFDTATHLKRIRGPIKCRGTREQNNIIVFAGAGHIECFNYVFDKILPANSCKYSQENTDSQDDEKISKILEIDRKFGFKNFNELMIDFCN